MMSEVHHVARMAKVTVQSTRKIVQHFKVDNENKNDQFSIRGQS